MRARVVRQTVRACLFLEVLLVRTAHCRSSLRQWAWTTMVLPAVAGIFSSGCFAMEMAYVHSTSFVAPAVLSASPSPAAGALVAIKVEDRRADVAGYEVGAKYNPKWGYEGSTIDLKDKASLADQVTQDAAALLHEQGYRTLVLPDAPDDSVDIRLTIRIEVFNVFLVLGQDVFLDGLYLMEAVWPGESRSWTDAVGARFELASSMYPSDAEFQRCFEQLYSTLRDKMRDRLKAELSP